MSFFKKVTMACMALLGFGCNSPSTAPQSPSEAAASWHDELSYGFMDTDDDKEAAKAFQFAKKSGYFENYYARFNLGNLYFIQCNTPAPKFAQDADGKSGYLGVIMGPSPRLVTLPDKVLFAQFMTAIRPAPDKLKFDRRIKAIEVLAGTGEILTKQTMEGNNIIEHYQIEPQDPSWTENNGELTFDYYTFRSRGSSMMAPALTKCRLSVDREQQYTISCEDIEKTE